MTESRAIERGLVLTSQIRSGCRIPRSRRASLARDSLHQAGSGRFRGKEWSV